MSRPKERTPYYTRMYHVLAYSVLFIAKKCLNIAVKFKRTSFPTLPNVFIQISKQVIREDFADSVDADMLQNILPVFVKLW